MFDIYIDNINNQNCVTLLHHQKHVMEDIFLDYPKEYDIHNPKWAAIYYARIEHIDTELNAAFVDLGNNMKGILQAKHIYISGERQKKLPSHKKNRLIAQLVQPGDWMFMQVKAEGQEESCKPLQKLPRLTTKIYIAGRTLLYSPNVLGMSSTHWVSDQEEQFTGKKLTEEHEKGGWVIRQMAADLPNDVLYLEAESLIGMWKRAKDRAREALETKTTTRVMTAPNAIERALIDYGRRGINHFETMTAAQADTAKAWARRFAPDLLNQIHIAKFSPRDKVKSLFEAHDIHEAIESLAKPIVQLPSGGNIIIERTQACTIIDINSAGANSFRTNMEAAAETMRQIRLRNLGGIIICDMINEKSKNKKHQILKTFDTTKKYDPADPQIHGFTRLMMVEITRRRRSASLSNKSRRKPETPC